ncbi:MAG: lamin tail domain-containing protein [Patescibacteria group bacterium]
MKIKKKLKTVRSRIEILFIGIFLFLIFITPVFANAQIIINEIAWMGTATSTNDEWLEIYNQNQENIDLSGWTLDALDGTPRIELTGNILPQGYFLLERTDDSTIPNITADQIYQGALSNAGEILILKNSQGLEIDRVDGSNDWTSVGGDNDSKYTAQKISNGWVTMEPTPKAINVSVDKPEENSPNIATQTNIENPLVISSDVNSTVSREAFIKADAGENIIAQVGQNIFFDGSKSEGNNMNFSWNMGNGDVKNEKSFLYNFSFPGKYLVTLFVEDGLHKSQDQIDVTIYPSSIFISEFFSGDKQNIGWIEIFNNSENFVDISGWKIDNGGDTFEIPKGTFLASGNYLIFSEGVLGSDFITSKGEIFLLYPNGQTKDKVKYDFLDNQFSASRKNKEEFVFTKSKTPGFSNVTTYSDEVSVSDFKKLSVNKNKGVPKNLISENFASFVSVAGKKSFLIEPAYAMVSDGEEEFYHQDKKLNLSSNASSLFNDNFTLIAFFAVVVFLAGFLLAKKIVFKKIQ